MPEPRGEVALVTGAGGALGGAVVSSLLDHGFDVVGVDRDAAALEALPAAVRREAADLGDATAVRDLFDRVAAAGGDPAVVVHTVGAFRAGAAADSAADDLRLMLDVNVATAWEVSRAAAARMRAAGRGAIVHIGARHAVEPLAGAAAYSVSKAALVHLTRVLDVELRPSGIRVNAVLPGVIDTPANRAAMPEAALARAVAPAAIARVVAFLVTDGGAPVVGAVVPVYGAG